MTLGTCARCPAQAVRTLGMAALCGDCVERILAPIRARVLERDGPRVLPATTKGGGVGRQVGRSSGCADPRQFMLMPPEIDFGDRSHDDVMGAVVERMAVAIEAISQQTEHEPGWADLCCDQCGATWTGRIDTACSWCDERIDRQWDDQRRLVLTRPDVDPDDRTYPQTLVAWGERLNRAIETALISVEEASNAYRKAVGRERAA
jgi:hypothetical protein